MGLRRSAASFMMPNALVNRRRSTKRSAAGHKNAEGISCRGVRLNAQ